MAVSPRRRAPHPCWARMQGHYPGNRGVRPLGVCGSEHRDAPPARLFLCADCRAQAVICSCCDRGQVYCAGNCAQRARRRKQDAAGRRYQTSRRGRLAHAERARRYRARCNKVTHQGSPAPSSDDFLSLSPGGHYGRRRAAQGIATPAPCKLECRSRLDLGARARRFDRPLLMRRTPTLAVVAHENEPAPDAARCQSFEQHPPRRFPTFETWTTIVPASA